MVEMEQLKPLESINWLARNKHGRLCGYDRLPTKSEDRWLPKEGHSFVIMPSTPKHDYIQWKDEHPTYISTLTILPAKEDKTMLKTFTKSDLQTGMVVLLADNTYWWVVCNVSNANERKSVNLIREATETDPDFLDLGNYTEDLLWNTASIPENLRERYTDQHIQKVFRYKYAYDVIQTLPESDMEANSILIWERNANPEPKDLTLTEIEKLLGYPIRITNTSLKEEN